VSKPSNLNCFGLGEYSNVGTFKTDIFRSNFVTTLKDYLGYKWHNERPLSIEHHGQTLVCTGYV
jgi:hypothetical protein